LDNESQITNIDKYNYYPKCNPGKNIILFTSSHADYGGDLVICDQNGLSQKVIIHKNQISSPFWSPDGEKIVFVTDDSNLAIIDKNGGNYKIINEISGACMDPEWSDDGNYILYYRAVFYN
jgi:Tol biopolymer transport system component